MTRPDKSLERKSTSTAANTRLPLSTSHGSTNSSTTNRVLRSNSREPAPTQSLKRTLNDSNPSHAPSHSKRPTHWPRRKNAEVEMSTPVPVRHAPVPHSTQQSTAKSSQLLPDQVLQAHDKARELAQQLELAQQQIGELERKNAECTDREFGLERKVLELGRELRDTTLRLEDREGRVSKLEQDRKVVSSQIASQDQERRKAIEEAELKAEKSQATTQAALEEVQQLKGLNSSLEQRVRLLSHNEARAQQVSSDAQIRIKLLEDDKARLESETQKLMSQVTQHQSEVEKLQNQIQQSHLSNSRSASDSVSSREVLRDELIRQVDQFKALEQANARMTRELTQLRTHHSNIELLKEENHQFKQRLALSDQLRQQLASTEVELSKLSQERSEWTIFIEQHQHEFKSPHEFFKSLASQRIENASLKARLGSRESEIKSRDRMIGELEARLEEVERQRDDEFAEKLKAQGQAQIAERNRDLDKRRIQMLNEQLKSYTAEERSFSDGTSYDEQKELQLTQLKELLDSHQEELVRVQREAAELRQQLQAQPSGSPSHSHPVNPGSPEKGAALKTSLTEQINRNEELELELDELADANEMLKMEMESLQLQVHRLERDLGRGEYNSTTTQVLCPEGSPVDVEQAIRTERLESLKAENGALLRRIGKLEKGIRQTTGDDVESLVPRESLNASRQEIVKLEVEVSKQIKARERLCEMYKETTASYKRAIWEILGYSLEAVANGEFRLRSAFKDESSCTMLFVPTSKSHRSHHSSGTNGPANNVGGIHHPQFEFKPNLNHAFHQSNLVVDHYNHWVLNRNSIPCFTAALTLDLFKIHKG